LVDTYFAKTIFRTLKEKGFIWSLTGGLDRSRLTYEIADLLIENNCSRVNIGIESENISLLHKYHKYRKVAKKRLELVPYIRRITEGGVETFGDLMIGFPEQTLKDIGITIDYAKHLKENGLGLALFHIVTPFPGTGFFNECKEKGFISEPIKHEEYTFARGNISTSNFSAEQMTNLRVQAFIDVNGQTAWEESRKTLQRPNLQKYYLSNPENKWSAFFSKPHIMERPNEAKRR
jgi:radical SAM superfamily enzyme YgiQ (UPF0313 family)